MKNLRLFRRLIIAALFFNILTQAQAQVQTAKYVSMDASTLGYYEYLPQGYNTSGQSYPLILFIHGLGELGNGTTQLPTVLYNGLPRYINMGAFPTSFTVNGQTSSFIVISPQFTVWPSSANIDNILNYLTSHYRVNISKIYITGLSMGGGVTWEYAGGSSAYANRVAAIVPVCGASWPDLGRSRTIANANVPVWATHNDGDPTAPLFYSVDYVKYINQAPTPNPPARISIFQSPSHDAWTKTYDPNFRENGLNIYEWMLQYSKGYVPPATTVTVNKTPVASAGYSQTITLPVSSVNLNGTASDPDGSIASYQWSLVSGPNSPFFGSAGSAATSVNGLVEGNYTFRLTVKDNAGASATSDVNVTVNAAPASAPATSPSTSSTRVEAENWTSMNGVTTEGTSDAGGGLDVTSLNNGDWMEYRINAPAAGSYTLNLRIASAVSGGYVMIGKQTGAIIGSSSIPNTGGAQNWQTVPVKVTLDAGQQIIRVASTEAPAWNFNWIELVGGTSTTSSTSPAPSTSTTTSSSGSTRVEGENWTSMSGVTTENTSDAGGGLDVTALNNGDWMEYKVSPTAAGTYTLNLRVASAVSGGYVMIGKQTGAIIGSSSIPNTGGAQNWQTVPVKVTLDAGQQIIRIASTENPSWNLNWLDFSFGSTTATTSPLAPATTTTTSATRVEAENYVGMSGIATENTSDAGGGLDVTSMNNGDWMEYKVTASVAGTYTLNLRVAAPGTGGYVMIGKQTGAIIGSSSIPNTGGAQSWQTLPVKITLDAGQQIIRVASTEAPAWNFNWMEISAATGTVQAKGTSESILSALEVFPNTIGDRFQLKVNNPYRGSMQVRILDSGGSTLKSFTLNKSRAGAFQSYLSIEDLKAGTYQLQLTMNNQQQTKQIIKE